MKCTSKAVWVTSLRQYRLSLGWTRGEERRGGGTLSEWTCRVRKRQQSGGKRLKKKEGLFTKKLISRGFLVVEEAYPPPSCVLHSSKKHNLDYSSWIICTYKRNNMHTYLHLNIYTITDKNIITSFFNNFIHFSEHNTSLC